MHWPSNHHMTLVLAALTALLAWLLWRGRAPKKWRYMTRIMIPSRARVALAIDVTGSMNTRDCPDGLSRLEYTKRCIEFIVDTAPPQVRFFDVIAFGTAVRKWVDVQRSEVPALLARIEANESQTFTGAAVSAAGRLVHNKSNGGCILIFTDGEPADPATLTLAMNSHPYLEPCGLSVGRGFVECVVARAEDVTFAWGARSEFPPPPNVPAPLGVDLTPRVGVDETKAARREREPTIIVEPEPKPERKSSAPPPPPPARVRQPSITDTQPSRPMSKRRHKPGS